VPFIINNRVAPFRREPVIMPRGPQSLGGQPQAFREPDPEDFPIPLPPWRWPPGTYPWPLPYPAPGQPSPRRPPWKHPRPLLWPTSINFFGPQSQRPHPFVPVPGPPAQRPGPRRGGPTWPPSAQVPPRPWKKWRLYQEELKRRGMPEGPRPPGGPQRPGGLATESPPMPRSFREGYLGGTESGQPQRTALYPIAKAGRYQGIRTGPIGSLPALIAALRGGYQIPRMGFSDVQRLVGRTLPDEPRPEDLAAAIRQSKALWDLLQDYWRNRQVDTAGQLF